MKKKGFATREAFLSFVHKRFSMEVQPIRIKDLEMNTGQIDGLPSNPRQWTKDEIDNLKKSISETPELLEARGAIVYPKDGKYIVLGGNMRLEAVRALGWKEMPCIVLPEFMPVEKLKEIVIKDNGSFGEWDMDALANDWDDLPLSDWGVSTSWGGNDEININSSSGSGTCVQEDDFEEVEDKVEQIVKLGEIWQCGNHIVMCGDSSDADSVKRLLGGVKADMVFTDPPYGVAIGDKNKTLNSVQPSGRCTENIKNDNISIDELEPILVKAMTNCRENCTDEACYFVTSPQGGELGLMMMMMRDAGLPVRHMLIWEKNSATFSLGRLDYDYQHEPIFYTWTKKHHNYRKGEYRTTIWKYDKPRKCDLHPTMKPVALVANCLMDGSKEGDIILDVFGGSGTTMIACEQLGRKARLMELDPHYCDVIIARWEKMTGKKAEKIG